MYLCSFTEIRESESDRRESEQLIHNRGIRHGADVTEVSVSSRYLPQNSAHYLARASLGEAGCVVDSVRRCEGTDLTPH